jgi:hypothetical protein
MSKIKMTKGQAMIYNTLRSKLKIEEYRPHYTPGVNGRVSSSCTTGDTRSLTFIHII